MPQQPCLALVLGPRITVFSLQWCEKCRNVLARTRKIPPDRSIHCPNYPLRIRGYETIAAPSVPFPPTPFDGNVHGARLFLALPGRSMATGHANSRSIDVPHFPPNPRRSNTRRQPFWLAPSSHRAATEDGHHELPKSNLARKRRWGRLLPPKALGLSWLPQLVGRPPARTLLRLMGGHSKRARERRR